MFAGIADVELLWLDIGRKIKEEKEERKRK
jgi:hypothetical protein